MYRGWLSFGGNEIANNERVRTLTRTAPVPMGWFVDPKEPTVQTALSPSSSYDYSNIADAPWYDSTLPESQNFFGVYVMSITGLPDGTRQSAIVESIYDGGSAGIPRKAVKQVVVNAVLTARGLEALEYGLTWLDAVLDSEACGQHSNLCGLTDLEFLADIPPVQGGLDRASYDALVDTKRRYLHSVWAVNSPKIQTELESNGVYGYNVSFTIAAGRPFIYTKTQDLDLPPTIPVVYQDIPYNLVPYPSLEIAGGNQIVSTNYHPNPSLEVDASSWAAAVGSTVSGAAATPYLTSGRSTDIAADRTASYRVRVLGDGATAATGETQVIANSVADLTVPIGAGAGTRVSFTAWLSMFVLAGAGGSTLKSMKLDVIWLNSSNAQVGATVNIGSTTSATDFNGRVFAAQSLVPPAGAVKARVQATWDFIWTSSTTPANNSDIRGYIDAVAVTVP